MQAHEPTPLTAERPPPLVAVVDSCVFPHRKWIEAILAGARDGFVLPVWSPLIIAEVNRLLMWIWLKRAGGDQGEASWARCSEDSKKWFAAMTRYFRMVDDHPPYEAAWSDEPADPWDVPIWTAAVRARRTFRGAPVFIVTENLKDGPPKDKHGLQFYRGVGFIHPRDFPTLISVWADFSVTGERPHRGSVSPTAGTSTSQPSADVSLPADVEELLRQVSSRLGKP